MDIVQKILRENQILSHTMQGILTARIQNADEGFHLTRNILHEIVDKKTLLFLSGGRTPKTLYEALAREEKIVPGAVGMIDERYGEKFHPDSNEKMIRDTGLLRYLEIRDIPFYPILASGESRRATAEDYDLMLRELRTIYEASVGILGIGSDGHTAGIPSQRQEVDFEGKTALVTEYNDQSGIYGERVTMTFSGLAQLDVSLVLVFGADKKKALELVFSEGSEEEVPGRFYKRPDIAVKTLFITDQMI